jgi:hypothetical protein
MVLDTNEGIAQREPSTLVLIAEHFRIFREKLTCHMLVTLILDIPAHPFSK